MRESNEGVESGSGSESGNRVEALDGGRDGDHVYMRKYKRA